MCFFVCFDELLIYLIHENKYMTITLFKRPFTYHPDPCVPHWSTHGARENSWGLQTQLETYPEQELGLKGRRRNPPGWWSYHLFTTGGETVLMEEVGGHSWGTPSGLALIHHVAMTGLAIGIGGMILQSLSVWKVGSNQRWSEGGTAPLVVTPWANLQKGPRNSFPRGALLSGWLRLVGVGSIAGTETLTEGVLGITRGLWKVTPEGAGLGSWGSFVQWALAGGDLCQGH